MLSDVTLYQKIPILLGECTPMYHHFLEIK